MSQEMLIGQILRALSNHSELITQAYTQGRVQTESSTNIQLLVNSGLLQGNTSDGFRLVAPLRDMLDIVIQREKRRIKALDVAAWREQVIHLVEQYTNALQEDRHDDAQFHFQSLRDEIYTLSDSMSDQTHLLGLKLENEFGYVSTMAEKRRENAQLLKQAERLMDAMSIVSHDDLDEWGSSHFELRQLLNSELDRHIFAARERLNLILPRLRHKLFGQSIPDQQTALVKKWQSYLFRHPEYVPERPAEVKLRDFQATAFNTIAAAEEDQITLQPNIGLHNENVCEVIAARISQKEYREKSPSVVENSKNEVITIKPSAKTERLTTPSEFQKLVKVFISTMPPGQTVSALHFLKSTQTDLKPRDWLLGLHIWTNQDLRRSRLSKRLSAKPLRQSEEKGLGNVLISDYEFYLND
jgi:hypothetical protein